MTPNSPAIPNSDRLSKTRNGLRPPVVSTHAENGIRSSDPESAGAETRKPTMIGDRCITSWNLLAVGPNRATAANPAPNPRVAAKRLPLGVPLNWFTAQLLSWQLSNPLSSTAILQRSPATQLERHIRTNAESTAGMAGPALAPAGAC